MRRWMTGLLVVGLGFGCSTEVEGPEPHMSDGPDELVTDASFVCNEAHGEGGTWVTIDGEAFSPLVVDAIDSESDHDVELPVVTLTRRASVTGEELESESFVFDSPLGADDGRVRWIDDETLKIRISDDLELPQGVYDVEVKNPAGRVATSEETFGVVDPPELHTAIPEMTCVAQGERDIALKGGNLLVRGDEEEVPTVHLDGEEVEVVDTAECRELHDTFADHRLCDEVTVRIDEEQFEAGVYHVGVENFAPAGCPSHVESDGVTVTVNAPPEVHDISPSPVCSEQIEYEAMEIGGDEFVVVQDDDETIYPEVAVGERTYVAVDALDCEDVAAAPALQARRCTQLLIDVEADDLAEQVAGDVTHEDLDVVVTNPDPVGCHSEENEALTAMPPPSIETFEPDPMCNAQYDNEFIVEGHGFAAIGGEQPIVDVGGHTYEVAEENMEECTLIETPDVETMSCERLRITIAEGDFDGELDDGATHADLDVMVANPDPAGCHTVEEEELTVMPPPSIETFEPSPICTAQYDNEFVVEGHGFAAIDGQPPVVSVGGHPYEVAEENMEECISIETPEAETTSCERLRITIAEGDLDGELDGDVTHEDLDVVVTNPDPAGCQSVEDEALTVMPPPTVASVAPDPICDAQFDNDVVVDGHGFAVIDGVLPVVHIGDTTYEVADEDLENCTEIERPEVETVSCERLTITVAEEDLGVERHDVTVENPETAGCVSTEESTLQVVAPPVVDEMEPRPLCLAQEDRTMAFYGEGFLDNDGALPEVAIGGQNFAATEVDDCEDLQLDDAGREAQVCQTLFVDVDAGSLDAEVHDVVVTNPQQAHCSSEESLEVQTVPPPEITSVEPRALCTNEDATQFVVEGEHFYEVGGEAPTILLDGTFHDTGASGCSPAEQGDDVQVCTTLSFEADPQQIADDIHRMVAVNPQPIACESEESDPMVLAGPPQLDSTEPMAVCEGESLDAEMSLFGEFVHELGGEDPVVTMNGTQTTVEGFGDCQTTDVGDFSLDHCGELQTIVPTALRDQGFEVTVEGSDPVACGMDTIEVEEIPTPTITSVIPERICEDGGSLQVTGTDLHPDAEYFLDGEAATDVDYHSDQSVTVIFDGPLPTGLAEFEVINPGDCSAEYSEDIRVTGGPVPLFVDPPATYDGMTTQVTIYAAGLHGGSIEEVHLLHPDGTETELDYTPDDERPHIVQAVVPEDMLDDAEDSVDFGVRLKDDVDCGNEAPDLLTITSELTVAVEAIDPGFGGTDDETGVDIFADDDPDPGMEQFEAVPRAYLNPAELDDEDEEDMLAREVRSLQFVDDTELNGIVPSGLPVGMYDLIVVNPDGAIGVLEEAYEVTEESPPRIDGVSPGSWSNQESELSVSVEGSHFREGLGVEVFCQAPDEDLEEDEMANPNSISVEEVEDEAIELEIDVTNIDHLDVCFMRVTNDDGTFGEYAPITVTNPAGNFVEFNAGTSFDIPRRGPVAFSGVPSHLRHYLYVIGGDDGTSQTTAYSSGEFARLDKFGMPQEWNELPYHLPSGRTFADGVRIDDFLYLVGGYDADEEGPTDEVLRAQVLDPLDVPEIVNIDIILDDDSDEGGGGFTPDSDLDAGTYYYRVSAVYTSGDPANPAGESLASEPQPLTLPIDGLTVGISWEPPEHINHDIDYYNVYRSVEADDPYGDESLIATVDAPDTSYEDDGTDDPAAGVHPLPVGSLGTWHHVATLERERTVAGVTVATNPDDGDQHFIYAVAGEGIDDEGDPVELDDYEFVTVDADGPREQFVSDGTIGLHDGDPSTLPAGRIELRAGTADDSSADSVSDVNPQIFTIGGESDGDNDRNLYVATVNPDGHLDEWDQLPITLRLNNPRYGHGGAILNNNMVVAGGHNGQPDDSAAHAEIECEGDCPPATLGNWSSLSNVEMEERVYMGQEAFRGFWYLTGGLDTNFEATNTVDFSVAGGAP